jgi:hypothetical protein
MCDQPFARFPAAAAGSLRRLPAAPQSWLCGGRVFVRWFVGLGWRLCGADVSPDGGPLDDGLGAGGVSVAPFHAGRVGLAGTVGELVGAAGEFVIRFGFG